MNWQLAVFGLLTAVIVAGIAWYERSRPPSRMVALVAALAALAVAGRIVLAPIPNVVATTDIALITGYALGGAPGFAVGVLAAPVSNIWLGQGPWTPWQMAGWGLVGLAGAALGALTHRRLGRGGLAIACGLAGFAYGALLDFSVMVSYGGEQSLDRYLALSARGIPFNVAHAAGNVALALAAGPALVRMISRYRTRFEFTWRPASAAVALLLALSLAGMTVPAAMRAQAASDSALAKSGGDARRWLERHQNSDGGFGPSVGSLSNPAMSGWAVLGLEAAGRNPEDLRRGENSAIDYLRAHASSIRSTGDLERSILALTGAGFSPHGFGGTDLVAKLRDERSGDGSFSGQVNLTAFGLLALRAGGIPGSQLNHSAAWLRRAQNGDGGWGYRSDAPSDADSTGAALQGLAAAGSEGNATRKGVGFLRDAQRGEGGFALLGQSSSNSQSTAWAVQGAIAAGADPGSLQSGGHSPFDFLAARQAGDGHYRYSAASNQTPVWVTGQALLAVERQAFPLRAVPRTSQPGGLPPVDRGHDGDGAGSSGPGTGGSGGGPHHSQESKGKRSKAGEPSKGETHSKAAAGERTDATRARDVAAVPVSSAEPGDPAEDGGDSALWAGGGLAALAVLLAGGFLWYRRRLP
jgi:energy-coupling factor transport system substrate-specific component